MPDGSIPRPISASGLDALLEVADDFGALVLGRTDMTATVVVSPHVDGGGRDDFCLVLSRDGMRVEVREQPGRERLPRACPMRHVNLGGAFCLGWRNEDPSVVRDHAGAHAWWTALLHYLEYQLYAHVRRSWPQGRERAHGDAALYEARAEGLALRFGQPFLDDMRAGRLTLRRVGRSIRLERAGRRVFAIGDSDVRVANLWAPCPCDAPGRRSVLRTCSDHAAAAAGLVRAIQGREREEAAFYGEFARHARCCGTMDDCPLSSEGAKHSITMRV